MPQNQATREETDSKILFKADGGDDPLPKPKRMSISLPADSAAQLDFLATKQGISQNEAIRKAIATEAYLYEAIQEGSSIYIEKSDGKMMEVVFR